MIRSANHLKSFRLEATDGSLGSVKDFYFDDEQWVIRWVVVDTGNWLPGRKVLISPLSVSAVQWGEQRLALSISKDLLAKSPGVESHLPVSRQHEIDYFNYFGYPYYWGQPSFWGPLTQPLLTDGGQPPRHAFSGPDYQRRKSIARGDGHLRSCDHVRNYGIQATDGELGHVEDFLFDDQSWALRYVVVDTRSWWIGNKVLVAPEWIEDISWEKERVTVDVSRKQLKNAPRYDKWEHVDQQWEAAYYNGMRRPAYWLDVEPEDTAREKGAPS